MGPAKADNADGDAGGKEADLMRISRSDYADPAFAKIPMKTLTLRRIRERAPQSRSISPTANPNIGPGDARLSQGDNHLFLHRHKDA
jgi:hypothetical protein